VALVMLAGDVGCAAAMGALKKANGNVRKAIAIAK
jgi:hypothetical protein